MQNQNFNAPAFPPQVAQDNLGRIIAPIPGMSKLEYFAIQLLPFYLELATTKKLSDKGEPVTAVQAAINTAKDLIEKLNTNENEKDVLSIIE
jgi:hypothetical protein